MDQTELTLILLGITALLLIRNILRPDVIALMLLLSLGLTGILTPREAFSGFSRAAVVIMFSAGVYFACVTADGFTNFSKSQICCTGHSPALAPGASVYRRKCGVATPALAGLTICQSIS